MKLVISFLGLFLSQLLVAGPWYQKTDFSGDARHRSTAFAIGNAGYIGLGHINSGVDVEYEDFWRYDPASNSWSQIADYPEGKCYHAASFVVGNKAYVGTGRLENGTYTKHFYEYNPQLNTWLTIADFPGLARRGAVGFAIGNSGFVGTGQSNSGYTNDFYKYNPASNQWLTIPILPGPVRTSSVAFSIGNYGYIGTGDLNSGAGNDFFQFDPLTNQWAQKANVGPTPRQEAVGFSVGGKGYIGTGDDFSSGNNYGDFWEYDPSNNSWVQISDFDGTARRYLVGFTIGNRAYVGTGTNGTNFKDFWMFDKQLALEEEFMENFSVTIFPNPTNEIVYVKLNAIPFGLDIVEFSFEVLDSGGRKIKSGKFESMENDIHVLDFSQGVYSLFLSYQNTILKKTKFIVN